MITFSLNTFIRLCLLDTGGRISEIQKRLARNSGYDFYKSMQSAIRAHSSSKKLDALKILQAPTSEKERKYNQTAFDNFDKKFGSIGTLNAINSSKQLKFPDAGITIVVDPLFEISKAQIRQIYSVWPTQKPPLTQRYGALACHIMRRAYSGSSLANVSFYYSDLVSNKVYSEKQITNNTNLILTTDVNNIGMLVKEL